MKFFDDELGASATTLTPNTFKPMNANPRSVLVRRCFIAAIVVVGVVVGTASANREGGATSNPVAPPPAARTITTAAQEIDEAFLGDQVSRASIAGAPATESAVDVPTVKANPSITVPDSAHTRAPTTEVTAAGRKVAPERAAAAAPTTTVAPDSTAATERTTTD